MVAPSSLQSPVLPRKTGKCSASNVEHSMGYCGSIQCNSTQASFQEGAVETLLQALSGLSLCHPDVNQHPAPCKCWRHGDGLATAGSNTSTAAGWRHCTSQRSSSPSWHWWQGFIRACFSPTASLALMDERTEEDSGQMNSYQQLLSGPPTYEAAKLLGGDSICSW